MRTEADRKAFYKHIEDTEIQNKYNEQKKTWLRANPEIGELNNEKFYIFKDGKQINIKFLQNI